MRCSTIYGPHSVRVKVNGTGIDLIQARRSTAIAKLVADTSVFAAVANPRPAPRDGLSLGIRLGGDECSYAPLDLGDQLVERHSRACLIAHGGVRPAPCLVCMNDGGAVAGAGFDMRGHFGRGGEHEFG